MRIISEYVSAYRGHGVPLPSLVSRSAKFGLSLLPGLATAAAIEQKITGSDKGIW
jgi:hypothetical protein